MPDNRRDLLELRSSRKGPGLSPRARQRDVSGFSCSLLRMTRRHHPARAYADRLPIGYRWLKDSLCHRIRVNFKAFLVVAVGARGFAALLPLAQQPAHGARQAGAHAIARRTVPGGVL